MMTTTQNKTRSTFTRLAHTPTVKGMVKDAKKVGYAVEIGRFGADGKGEIYFYKITDGADLVFKATMVQRGVWGMTFSTSYFQEPTM